MKHMHYSPLNGGPILPMTVEAYRKNNPTITWEYNPWTGAQRHPDNIQADPYGYGCPELDEPLHAAEIDPQRVSVHTVVNDDDKCSCFPGLCRGGQVIDGKTVSGLICKARLPAPVEAPVQFGRVEKCAQPGQILDAGDLVHMLRNPHDYSDEQLREARLQAADTIDAQLRRMTAARVAVLPGQIIGDPYVTEALADVNTPAYMAAQRKLTDALCGLPADDSSVDQRMAAVRTLNRLGYTYNGGELWVLPLGKAPAFKAPDLLDAAAGHMRDRAKTYDKPEGERSMGATVEAFNAITGRDLRESEGWLLMSILKMVRSETRNAPHRDSIEDLCAYSGLYGEARLGGS